jgi:hypothetical protein
VLTAWTRLSGSCAVAPALSIIVATLNERENIEPLFTLIAAALPDTAWEVLLSMMTRATAR